MHLKKLELCGFKSFAGRTEIAFEPGITVIVGPNGCGKSNVVNAVQWVLGSMSTRLMRAEEMVDVIFNGAEGIPAMGFSEVSLALDNAGKTLAVDFEEVVLTRRLFRSGESEYSINRSACRLRDIRELLYGTGIGVNNYSIIEQGKIDRLILANAYERRLIFDEAAGITKYRAKRKEAESRLEKVTQDMLRLADRVRMTSKELHSVRIQAGRAERYRRLQEELRKMRLTLCLDEYRVLKIRTQESERHIEAFEEQIRSLEAERLRRQERQAQTEGERRDLEQRSAQTNADLAGAQSKMDYLQEVMRQVKARIAELERERDRILSEQAALQEKRGMMDRERSRCLANLQAVESDHGRTFSELRETREKLVDADRECRRLAEEMEAKKAEAVELAHKEAQYRSERSRMQRDTASLQERTGRLQQKAALLEGEIDGLLRDVSEGRSRREGVEKEIEALLESKKLEEEAGKILEQNLSEVEARMTSLREARERACSRRETLNDLERQLEGLDAGVQELLRARMPGILGTVADFIEVDPEHLFVVEAALADRAGYLVAENAERAFEAIRTLKERKLGHAGIIPLDLAPRDSREGVRTAAEFVRVQGRAADLVLALLRTIPVVDSLEQARTLAGMAGEGVIVTVEGDRYDRGIYTIGKRGPTLLSRKTALRSLELEIQQLGSETGSLEQDRLDLVRRSEIIREKLEMIRQRVYELKLMLQELAGRQEHQEKRRAFLSEEVQAIRGEIGEAASLMGAHAERDRHLESLLTELADLNREVATEIARGMDLGRTFETSRMELQKVQSELEVAEARLGEQRGSLMREEERLRAESAAVDAGLVESASRLEDVENRIAEAQTAEERDRVEISRLADGIERDRAELAEREKRHAAVVAEEARLREDLRSAEMDLDQRREDVNRRRLEAGEDRVRLEHVLASGREEFQVDLEQVNPGCSEDIRIDRETLAADVVELKRRVDSFGSVNLCALERLKEMEEQEKFLCAQEEDLSRAKKELTDLIQRVNQESRELFEGTLASVRDHFSVIFRKLFSGGKAEILLEEVEGIDPLEQGIEIRVRPPQKELTSLSLLSGGEKTLTALALVMALFKANPSPFCILDEADAALDEANVDRFAALVREFSKETQFLVITHNKRTMAMGDVLYGVTMEQPGVSKKVRVNLTGDEHLEMIRKKEQVLTLAGG